MRAKSRRADAINFVYPFRNLGRRKRLETVEAHTMLATHYFVTMIAAMTVRPDMIWIGFGHRY